MIPDQSPTPAPVVIDTATESTPETDAKWNSLMSEFPVGGYKAVAIELCHHAQDYERRLTSTQRELEAVKAEKQAQSDRLTKMEEAQKQLLRDMLDIAAGNNPEIPPYLHRIEEWACARLVALTQP